MCESLLHYDASKVTAAFLKSNVQLLPLSYGVSYGNLFNYVWKSLCGCVWRILSSGVPCSCLLWKMPPKLWCVVASSVCASCSRDWWTPTSPMVCCDASQIDGPFPWCVMLRGISNDADCVVVRVAVKKLVFACKRRPLL